MEDPRLKARNAIGSLTITTRIDPRRSRGRTTLRDQITMATEPAHHGLRAKLEMPCQNWQPEEVDNWRERESLDASSLDKEDCWEFAYLPHVTCAH